MYWNKLSSMCCSPNKKQCFVNSRSIDIKMLWTPYSRGTIAIWTLEPYLAFFLNFRKIEFLHGQILYLDCLFTLNCANSVINPNGVNIRSMQILRPVVAFEWPFFTSVLWLVKLLANLLAMLLANHLVVRNSTQLIKCGGRQKFYLDRWRNISALFGKKWSNSITQLEEIGLRHLEVLIPLLL